MCILFRGKHAKNIVVFVYRLAVVAAFLLVPPVGVGITELARDCRGIDVAAIHVGILDIGLREVADLWVVDEGADGRAQQSGQGPRCYKASSEHLHSINTLGSQRSDHLKTHLGIDCTVAQYLTRIPY